jgi:thiamine-phosphate pyrophosphorylase
VHTPGERLATASLYLCTDARRERGDLAEFAEAALAGGVDIIQLRDKGSAGEQQYGPLEALRELEALEVLADAARRHGALLAVNDRADIAVAAGADVLHLGQDDLPLPIARRIIGPRPVIGRSTHDRVQASAAVAEEVDYFCVGPCWPTPTKPGRPAPGLDLVRAAAELASGAAESATSGWDKPWFAIGGIDEQRLPEVLAAGARRIVVVRAITGAEDPQAAAQRSACNNGIVAATSRSRSQLAANPGCNGRSATSSSATQRSSALSRLGTVSSNSAASAITVV